MKFPDFSLYAKKKKKKYSSKPINLRISKADPITEKRRHVHKLRVTDSNYHVIIPQTLELILVINHTKYRKFKRQMANCLIIIFLRHVVYHNYSTQTLTSLEESSNTLEYFLQLRILNTNNNI